MTPLEKKETEHALRRREEQAALIRRIAASRFLVGSPTLVRLLDYLFKHRGEPVSGKDIAVDVFGANTTQELSSTKMRQQCKRLRESLERFADADVSDGNWRCFLPVVEGNEGYQLRMVNLLEAEGAAHGFWLAHVEPPRPVIVVCNEPLFFRDPSANLILRYMNTLSDQSEGAGIPNELTDLLPAEMTQKLRKSYLYMLSGEVRARDCIADWFGKEIGTRVRMQISGRMDVSEIANSSPILLGNCRTNTFIRKIFEAAKYRYLAYRDNLSTFGTTEIVQPVEKELEAVSRLPQEIVERTANGMILRDQVEADKLVFGVVTRLPNPYGEGAVTILSSGYTRTLHGIAQTLTNERRVLQMLQTVGWPHGQAIPESFQGLFSVRMDAIGIDAEARMPELLCWREYSGGQR